ncbi:acyl-CoA dehydrogenase family protein [Nakamurella lactea]|uniref:acyl-CoA dehydrogenase family protein n=1 Tax=Nakamurella lactea TaxID=459515 RepID=UPI0004070BC0|nr:acyl-CoA dehydrogenase family protein [Nakamurella lactea]
MDFSINGASQEFRREAREMIAAELTPQMQVRAAETGTLHDWGFHRKLAERGWIGLAWPKNEGGAGLDQVHKDILWEEMTLAGAPALGLSITLIIAETIRRVGTPEQRARILPRVLAGELVLALGYSEPEAGSDLASVRTRATREGDGWLINGQKIFTTLAHEAGYIFLLARTDPDAPKHQGMTMFLVPTDAQGFAVTPIFTLSGERTNATFYSDVHVGDDARIGEVGDGWKVVTLALAFERGPEFAAQLHRLVDASREAIVGSGRQLNAGVLSRFGRLVADTEVSRLLGERASAARNDPGAGYVEGAMAKVFATEALIRDAGMMLAATGPAGARPPGDPAAPAGGEIQQIYREAQIATIYGGTSEVLRGVVAERRLGLPRSRRSSRS